MNSTAHASVASKPQKFFEQTLRTYDKNSVLPSDVNTCDIMLCGNGSQALQVIPIPKSANWIDIKLQQRTTSNSDYMSAQNMHLTNHRLNRPCRFIYVRSLCVSDTAVNETYTKSLCYVDRERNTKIDTFSR
jgi:hypothetical protein